MRPSTQLFHVRQAAREELAETAPRSRAPSIVELDLDDDDAPGVTAEAWHKARGWASED